VVPALTLSALAVHRHAEDLRGGGRLNAQSASIESRAVGQGAGNIVSALVGACLGPGPSWAPPWSTWAAAATSRLSGVFEGVFSLLVFLLLSRLVGWVPIAALAGILIVVAFRMFDRTSFHLLKQRKHGARLLRDSPP